MSRRDGYSRGSESMEDIRASDRFIEQLRVSGTYEPSTRTDAMLATALLTWRDDARQESRTPSPRVEEIGDIRPFVQPRRIVRRGVAAAGVLLVMSSGVAAAVDGDPLRPVRFLVDLGVDVGERIAHPDSESSSGEASEGSITGEENDRDPYWSGGDETDYDDSPGDDNSRVEPTDPKDAISPEAAPGTNPPVVEPDEGQTDGGPEAEAPPSEVEETQPDPDPTPSPDPEPTPSPDPDPTPSPDPEPTPSPDPEPSPSPDGSGGTDAGTDDQSGGPGDEVNPNNPPAGPGEPQGQGDDDHADDDQGDDDQGDDDQGEDDQGEQDGNSPFGADGDNELGDLDELGELYDDGDDNGQHPHGNAYGHYRGAWPTAEFTYKFDFFYDLPPAVRIGPWLR